MKYFIPVFKIIIFVLFFFSCTKDTPQASFLINQTGPYYAPASLSFKNTSSKATGYFWDFGDGERSDIYSPAHVFEESGTYTISLRAENYRQGEDTYSLTIEIKKIPPPPVAAFSFSPDGAAAPAQVTFSNSSQYATAGYSWNFGDNTAISTSENPSHSYSTPGNYTVVLTANGYGGQTATASKTVKVITPSIPPPSVSFTFSPTSCEAPCTVTFNNTTTGSLPINYLWDFDDNSTSTSKNPSHPFGFSGIYNVTLTASNAGGSSTKTAQITIQQPSSNNTEAEINFVTIWDIPNATTYGYYDQDGYPDIYADIYYWSDALQDWVFDGRTYYYDDVSTLPYSLNGDTDNNLITHLDKLHEIRIYDWDFGSEELMSWGQFTPAQFQNSNIEFSDSSSGELRYTLYINW